MLGRGCVFEEGSHVYKVDGRTVPSVTRVLDHAGLVSYDMVRRDILERKSRIGQIVHIATQYYDEGHLDWDSLDEYSRGRTEAWALFRSDSGFTPRLIEERYVTKIHGMEYGLTIDREGLWKGKECIVEIKTSATDEDWWSVQTAGYALGVPDPDGKLRTQRALFAARRRIAVQLFPNGKYKKFDFDDNQDAEVFLAGLLIAHWKLSKGQAIRRIEE